jgi:DNA-binding protein HU-beta
MDTQQILADLHAEKAQIEKAITALEALNGTAAGPVTATQPSPAPKQHRARRISPAARKRISQAAKARWARLRAISEVKMPKAQKPAPAKKSAPAKAAAKKAAPPGTCPQPLGSGFPRRRRSGGRHEGRRREKHPRF